MKGGSRVKKLLGAIIAVLALIIVAVIMSQTAGTIPQTAEKIPQVEAEEGFVCDQHISVMINGERVVFSDQHPIIVSGRTLVPPHEVFEKLGFDVTWRLDTNTVSLKNDKYNVSIQVERTTFLVNDLDRTTDAPAQLVSNRGVVVPIRAIAESLGYFVDWDAETRTVKIDTIDGVWNLWMASCNFPDSIASAVTVWAVSEIRERTNGRVAIEYFSTAGILGGPLGYIGIDGAVKDGIIGLAVVPLPPRLDYRFEIKYIPWLIEGYTDAKTLWTEGSNFMRLYNEVSEAIGLRTLGFLPGGFMGIGTIEPFNHNNVWDFTRPSTELLIRLPPFTNAHLMADVMQLRAVEISFTDLYPALSRGVVDGWIGGGAEINYRFSRDVINYFYDFRYYDDSFSIVMNGDLYNRMPIEFRTIIREVMAEAMVKAFDMIAVRDEYYLQKLRDHGITVFVPTDAERAQMAYQFRTLGWPRFADIFGLEIMNALLEDVGLPPIQ